MIGDFCLRRQELSRSVLVGVGGGGSLWTVILMLVGWMDGWFISGLASGWLERIYLWLFPDRGILT